MSFKKQLVLLAGNSPREQLNTSYIKIKQISSSANPGLFNKDALLTDKLSGRKQSCIMY